jgi:glycine cleavage system H lipoate-binding protein
MVALFVILTILVCVGVDGIIQLRKSRRESVNRLLADQLVPAEAFANLSAPADLFLDEGHTWVKVTAAGTAEIGLDRFAQKLIGRIDSVVLPEKGKAVKRGDMLFAVRQDAHRAAFASPVDGVVTMVDQDLPWHPEMIQSDPYKEGWVCALKPTNLAKNLKDLHIADESRAWLKAEAQRFQEFFAARPLENMQLGPQLGRVLRDGGQLTQGVLEFTDDETWKEFNKSFLHPQVKEVS